jgi:hypothetical protein
MVTHDPRAASYADRVVFLADGSIVDELEKPTESSVLDRMKSLDPYGRLLGEGEADADDVPPHGPEWGPPAPGLGSGFLDLSGGTSSFAHRSPSSGPGLGSGSGFATGSGASGPAANDPATGGGPAIDGGPAAGSGAGGGESEAGPAHGSTEER